MPDPPSVGFVTRYVCENPYPLAVGLLLIAAVIGWLGFQAGRMERVRLALIPTALGLAVIAAGWRIVTSGEHGVRVTREFVDAATTSDLVGAVDRLAPDALFHVGSGRNVGHDRDWIIGRLDDLDRRFSIDSNRITALDGYTEGPDRATVHLACRTDEAARGLSLSRWVVAIERQGDRTWLISDITFISLNGQSPPSW